MTVLADPASGRAVTIRRAQLPQNCGYCRAEMQGRHIVDVEGDGRGWTCLDHLERRLAAAKR